MSLLSIEKKRKRLGYAFLLPSALILGTFLFYPVVNSVVMSFTDWTGLKRSFDWIGFANYDRLLNDTPEYWASIGVNLKFALISSVVQTVLGFLLAFIVFHLTKRWQKFYQIALYVPAILPAAAVAVMWVFIYDPNFGLLNQGLNAIGLSSWAKGWLGEPSTALGSVIVTNTWRFVGFTMILYYIAMLNLSKDVLESSTVDGAGKLRQLWHFFIPLTWGTTEINFLLSVIGGMKSFDLFYLMTGGGPGTTTQVVGMLIYREAFQNMRFSSALTMSVVLFVLILIISVVSRLLLRQKNS